MAYRILRSPFTYIIASLALALAIILQKPRRRSTNRAA